MLAAHPLPMTTRLLLALLVCGAVRLGADTVASDTAVFAAPDSTSAVISRLKAGTTIQAAAGDAPAGWKRIEVDGPFTAFVSSGNINKDLEVQPGAAIRLAPKNDSPVLAIAEEGDKAEVTGLAGNGDWCRVSLEKKLTGYIAVGDAANRPTARDTAAATAPPRAPGSIQPGHAAPPPADSAELPRTFEGRLVTAARLLINPNPPYDYQLTDASGKRFAYVDLKRVTLNQRIEAVLDRQVIITGTLRNTVDGEKLVIAAESLRLK